MALSHRKAERWTGLARQEDSSLHHPCDRDGLHPLDLPDGVWSTDVRSQTIWVTIIALWNFSFRIGHYGKELARAQKKPASVKNSSDTRLVVSPHYNEHSRKLFRAN